MYTKKLILPLIMYLFYLKEMKTLKIHRQHIKSYSERKISILINGKVVAHLKDGESKIIEVEQEDPLELQAKSWWCGSKKTMVPIQEFMSVEIITNPNFYNQSWILLGSLMTPILVAIFNNHKSLIFLIFLLICSCLLLYTVTIGRNKWLTLKVK